MQSSEKKVTGSSIYTQTDGILILADENMEKFGFVNSSRLSLSSAKTCCCFLTFVAPENCALQNFWQQPEAFVSFWEDASKQSVEGSNSLEAGSWPALPAGQESLVVWKAWKSFTRVVFIPTSALRNRSFPNLSRRAVTLHWWIRGWRGRGSSSAPAAVMERGKTLECDDSWGKTGSGGAATALTAQRSDCRSGALAVLVRQLLLHRGFFWDDLQTASAPGLWGAGGTAHWASFTQVGGEGGVVDLLQVLLDFHPGVLQ